MAFASSVVQRGSTVSRGGAYSGAPLQQPRRPPAAPEEQGPHPVPGQPPDHGAQGAPARQEGGARRDDRHRVPERGARRAHLGHAGVRLARGRRRVGGVRSGVFGAVLWGIIRGESVGASGIYLRGMRTAFVEFRFGGAGTAGLVLRGILVFCGGEDREVTISENTFATAGRLQRELFVFSFWVSLVSSLTRFRL